MHLPSSAVRTEPYFIGRRSTHLSLGFGFGGSSDTVTGYSVDPLVGVGAAWHLPGHVTLRAQYTRFIDVGEKDKTGEINIGAAPYLLDARA